MSEPQRHPMMNGADRLGPRPDPSVTAPDPEFAAIALLTQQGYRIVKLKPIKEHLYMGVPAWRIEEEL